jgi:hypothetical protein
MAKKKPSKKYDCPICGQYMDFISIANRNTPYIDGKTYAKMCFGCCHAPMDEVQHYDKDGSITETEGPFYDHKHLHSVESMVSAGMVDTETEARKCLAGIRRRIAVEGVRKLNKLKLKRPKADYEFNPEFEEAQRQQYQKAKAPKRRRTG